MKKLHSTPPAGVVALELARPDIETAGLEILEYNAQTIWPVLDAQGDYSHMAFYIGKRGAATWDGRQWTEIPLPEIDLDTPVEQVDKIIADALAKAIEAEKAKP